MALEGTAWPPVFTASGGVPENSEECIHPDGSRTSKVGITITSEGWANLYAANFAKDDFDKANDMLMTLFKMFYERGWKDCLRSHPIDTEGA